MKKKLLSFGHGYSAAALEKVLDPNIWEISATTRTADKAKKIATRNVKTFIWPSDDISGEIKSATHILISIPPNEFGDIVLKSYSKLIKQAKDLKWIGYLSTTGVYGDHNGKWVNESTPLSPSTKRGKYRVIAERQWMALVDDSKIPLYIFRLAGIYGPGRGPFKKILNGTAKRIIKKGQVFSRIHVEDIARVLLGSINNPGLGGIYNVCDDLASPPEDVLSYAASLLQKENPPEIDFLNPKLSEMVRSFYSECKRVENQKIKRELGIELKYPNYKIGLCRLLKDEGFV